MVLYAGGSRWRLGYGDACDDRCVECVPLVVVCVCVCVCVCQVLVWRQCVVFVSSAGGWRGRAYLVPTNVCIGDKAGAGFSLNLVRGGERLMNDVCIEVW